MLKQPAKNEWRARLIQAIKDGGTNRKAVSLSIGRTENFLQRSLKQGSKLSVDDLIAICEHLDVSADSILFGPSAARLDHERLKRAQGFVIEALDRMGTSVSAEGHAELFALAYEWLCREDEASTGELEKHISDHIEANRR
ncbi:MAG: hypothetical protein AAF441_20005 [Pseudomonadota bacterium]